MSARDHELGLGVFASLFAKALTAAIPFITIPIALDYLGPVVYGLWMAASALTAMVAWLDLGLGNTLLTQQSVASVSRDTESGRRLLSTAVFSLLLVTASAIFAIIVLGERVPWSRVLDSQQDADPVLVAQVSLACALVFLLNLPLNLFQRTQFAWGRVVRNQGWQIAGGFLSVLLVVATVKLELPAPVVVAAGMSSPLLASIFSMLDVAIGKHKSLFPRPKDIKLESAQHLFRLSWRFLVLSLVTSTATNIDPLIVSQAASLSDVTSYTIPFRIFAILGIFITLVNTPLWPAVGRALAEGDHDWARSAARRMSLVGLGAVLMGGSIVLIFHDYILSILGVEADRSTLLACVGFGLWWSVVATTSPRMMVQNAASVLWPQVGGWFAFLVISIPAKYFVAVNLGVEWIPYAGALIFVFTVIMGSNIGYRLALRKYDGEPTAEMRGAS